MALIMEIIFLEMYRNIMEPKFYVKELSYIWDTEYLFNDFEFKIVARSNIIALFHSDCQRC